MLNIALITNLFNCCKYFVSIKVLYSKYTRIRYRHLEINTNGFAFIRVSPLFESHLNAECHGNAVSHPSTNIRTENAECPKASCH